MIHLEMMTFKGFSGSLLIPDYSSDPNHFSCYIKWRYDCYYSDIKYLHIVATENVRVIDLQMFGRIDHIKFSDYNEGITQILSPIHNDYIIENVPKNIEVIRCGPRTTITNMGEILEMEKAQIMM